MRLYWREQTPRPAPGPWWRNHLSKKNQQPTCMSHCNWVTGTAHIVWLDHCEFVLVRGWSGQWQVTLLFAKLNITLMAAPQIRRYFDSPSCSLRFTTATLASFGSRLAAALIRACLIDCIGCWVWSYVCCFLVWLFFYDFVIFLYGGEKHSFWLLVLLVWWFDPYFLTLELSLQCTSQG